MGRADSLRQPWSAVEDETVRHGQKVSLLARDPLNMRVATQTQKVAFVSATEADWAGGDDRYGVIP